MNRIFIAAVAVLASMGVALFSPSGVALAADWEWSATPYLWGSNTSMDVCIGDREVLDEEVAFTDLIDKLDFAFAVHLEGRTGKLGLLADVYFVDLGDDDKVYDLAASVPGQVVANGDLELTILELGGTFNPSGEGTGVSLIFGARIFDLGLGVDTHYEFDAGNSETRSYSTGDTLWDAMLGLRYVGRLSDRWVFDARADGSTGSTEWAWSAVAAIGYTYGREGRHAVLVGYRLMEIELKPQTDVAADITTQMGLAGPFAALEFGF